MAKNYADTLKRIPFFKECEYDALRFVSSAAETRTRRKGDILFEKGDVSDGGYVVLTGSVAFDLDTRTGESRHVILPECLIGARALITETVHSVTAEVLQPATIMQIPRSLFHRVLEEFPITAIRIHARLRRELEDYGMELNHILLEQQAISKRS